MAIYTSKYTRTQLDEGIGASYVPTLNSAPTTSTLTYTRSDLPSGSQTVSFVGGQMCRVAVTGGYDFYQLKNVSSNTATWVKVEYGGTIPANVAYFSNDSGEGVIPADGIRAETVTAGASISVNPDVMTFVSGSVSTATITLQVPNDGLSHVWDIILGTGSSVNITLADSTGAGHFLFPKGFEGFAANSFIEVSIVSMPMSSTPTVFFVRYGEFQLPILGS